MPFRRLLPRSKARTFGGTPFAYMNATILAGGDTVESIRALLFGAGEQGIYMPDMSDLTTLFQDRAGTTPVTAPGQSVGLILDKSRGLVLGSELASGILGGTSGWTFTGSVTVSGGVLAFASVPNAGAQAVFNPILSNARRYLITFTASGTGLFHVRAGSGGEMTQNLSAPGTFSMRLLSGGGTPTQLIFASAASSINNYVGNISNISVRELPGFHAVANSDAARGSYQNDGTRPVVRTDAADDGYQTTTITPGTDKVQVWALVRKRSDAAAGVVVELGPSVDANTGAFALFAPASAAANYTLRSRGNAATPASASYTDASVAAPHLALLTGLIDIAADTCVLHVNGVEVATTSADQGAGLFAAGPLNIARRNAASLPGNLDLVAKVVRFGPTPPADQIARVNRFLASRNGHTI